MRPQPRPHAVTGSPGRVGGAGSHFILPPSCRCIQEGLPWHPRGPGRASSVPGLPRPEEAGSGDQVQGAGGGGGGTWSLSSDSGWLAEPPTQAGTRRARTGPWFLDVHPAPFSPILQLGKQSQVARHSAQAPGAGWTVRGQAECPRSSCQGGPAESPREGETAGGQGPSTHVLSHDTGRGRGAGKARFADEWGEGE